MQKHQSKQVNTPQAGFKEAGIRKIKTGCLQKPKKHWEHRQEHLSPVSVSPDPFVSI